MYVKWECRDAKPFSESLSKMGITFLIRISKPKQRTVTRVFLSSPSACWYLPAHFGGWCVGASLYQQYSRSVHPFHRYKLQIVHFRDSLYPAASSLWNCTIWSKRSSSSTNITASALSRIPGSTTTPFVFAKKPCSSAWMVWNVSLLATIPKQAASAIARSATSTTCSAAVARISTAWHRRKWGSARTCFPRRRWARPWSCLSRRAFCGVFVQYRIIQTNKQSMNEWTNEWMKKVGSSHSAVYLQLLPASSTISKTTTAITKQKETS